MNGGNTFSNFQNWSDLMSKHWMNRYPELDGPFYYRKFFLRSMAQNPNEFFFIFIFWTKWVFYFVVRNKEQLSTIELQSIKCTVDRPWYEKKKSIQFQSKSKFFIYCVWWLQIDSVSVIRLFVFHYSYF